MIQPPTRTGVNSGVFVDVIGIPLDAQFDFTEADGQNKLTEITYSEMEYKTGQKLI